MWYQTSSQVQSSLLFEKLKLVIYHTGWLKALSMMCGTAFILWIYNKILAVRSSASATRKTYIFYDLHSLKHLI